MNMFITALLNTDMSFWNVIKKYPDPVLNAGCKEFEIDNRIISKFVLRELVPIVGIKPYPLNELMLMTAAVSRHKPSHIFEWGTHIGKSARIFYEIVKHFHIPCEIHSIDLPDNVRRKEHPGLLRGLFVKNIREVKLHQGDGLDVSLTLYRNYKNLRTKVRPLFFLDGDHEYRSVKRELKNIMKYAPEAWILVHDTFFQSSQSGYNTGPYRALQTVLRQTSQKYKILSTNTGLPGMTLLFN